MSTSHRILTASLAVAAVAAVVVAAVAISRVRAIHEEVDAATDSIHDQLDALDPVASCRDRAAHQGRRRRGEGPQSGLNGTTS